MQYQLSTHIHCLGNIGGFVVPIHSFLWTNWTNIEGIYCPEEHIISLGANIFMVTHPLTIEFQMSEMALKVFAHQLTDLGNGVYFMVYEGLHPYN